MKTINSIVFIGLLAVGCHSNHLSDGQVLTECWNASEMPGAQRNYRVRMNAIVIPAMEGGIYARTHSCPDYRLSLDYGNPDVREQFDRIAESVISPSAIGAGVKIDGEVRIKARRGTYLLAIYVTRLYSVERMTDQETNQFVREFDIG